MILRWMMVLSGALLAGTGSGSAGDKTYIVRDLAGRVGPIIGSALACRDIARPRIQVIVDKFTAVITENSSNEAERSDLTLLLDRNVADGRSAVTSGRIDCRVADRQLGDLERSIAGPGPSLAAAIALKPTAPAPNTAIDVPAWGRREFSTAPAPVWMPHPSGPTSRRSTSGSTRITPR